MAAGLREDRNTASPQKIKRFSKIVKTSRPAAGLFLCGQAYIDIEKNSSHHRIVQGFQKQITTLSLG